MFFSESKIAKYSLSIVRKEENRQIYHISEAEPHEPKATVCNIFQMLNKCLWVDFRGHATASLISKSSIL